MKRRAWSLAGILASVVALVACRSNPQVTFEVVLPASVSQSASWIEVGVIAGACPQDPGFAGGIPLSGTVARVAFQASNRAPPPIGDLKKAQYAFAAVARASDCGVLAIGCSLVDVSDARDVRITLAPTQQPAAGACASDQSCVDARCVPSPGQGGSTLGAGCSLEVVGAGSLGDSLDLTGSDVVSAPAVVATDSGFVLAYREYDSLAGAARLTVGVIDPGGGLTLAPQTTLPSQCSDRREDDGVGVSWAGKGGLVYSARPPCEGPPGLDAFEIDSAGAVTKSGFISSSSGKLSLSAAHALALTETDNGWLAYVDQGAAAVVAVNGLTTQALAPFGGPPPHTLAEVAASTQTVALLAASAQSDPDAGPGEGGLGGATLRVQLGSSVSTIEPPIVFEGTWGAIAVRQGRAFVVSDSSNAGRPVAWRAFEKGATGAIAAGTFTPPAEGDVLAGDVALGGDRALFVVEQKGGALSVHALDHASTRPTPLRDVVLSDDARIPSTANVRDGRIAIAASDSRVAVVWATAKQLGPDDRVGGYVVMACAP